MARTETRPPGGEELDVDGALEVLNNERRRIVIEVLTEQGGVPRTDLPRVVARKELGEEPGETEEKRVYVSLQQCHLPKLKDHGVVETLGDDDFMHAGPAFGFVSDVHEAVKHAADTHGKGLVTRLLG